MTLSELRHWQLDVDSHNIAWLILDRQGHDVNSLGAEVLEELEKLVDHIETSSVRGLIFISAKRSGFIAGADIEEFDQLVDEAAVSENICRVHRLFDRIEALSFPTVAAIHGFCLGGGLELALACDYRIAQDSDATRIGFRDG